METLYELREGGDAAAQVLRSLDHFVMHASDLTTAAEAYRRLGFRVMPVMEHVEIGTSNVIIQFLDTYLEIIGEFEHCRMQSLREKMQPWAALGDVFWMTSLTSAGLEADRALVATKGLDADPIVSARRRVHLPDGGWTETDSRSSYVWNERENMMSLFMSDHRRPEAIWIAGYQSHPNSVTGLRGVRYVAADPCADLDYFRAMFGFDPVEASDQLVRFTTPRGETLEIISQTACADLLPEAPPLQSGITGRGAGFTFAVESLERCRWALRDGGIPHTMRDRGLFVPATHACGMAIEFREEDDA